MIALALGIGILLSHMGVANAATVSDVSNVAENIMEKEVQGDLDDVIDTIDNKIYLDAVNGEINFSDENIVNICEEINIDLLNGYYYKMGMEAVTADEVADIYWCLVYSVKKQ